MREMTPAFYSDGPLRFYDLRLNPAGDLPTGTRVRVVATEPEGEDRNGGDHLFAGQEGVIKHAHHSTPLVELDPQYDPIADTTRPYGQLHQFSRASLEAITDTEPEV
jgi:hypothetical protein